MNAKRAGLCQLRDLLITTPEPLRSELRPLSRARLLRRLAATRPERRHDPELRGTLLALRALARRVQQLTVEERELAREIEQLTSKLAPQLLNLRRPMLAAQIALSWSHRGRLASDPTIARGGSTPATFATPTDTSGRSSGTGRPKTPRSDHRRHALAITGQRGLPQLRVSSDSHERPRADTLNVSARSPRRSRSNTLERLTAERDAGSVMQSTSACARTVQKERGGCRAYVFKPPANGLNFAFRASIATWRSSARRWTRTWARMRSSTRSGSSSSPTATSQEPIRATPTPRPSTATWPASDLSISRSGTRNCSWTRAAGSPPLPRRRGSTYSWTSSSTRSTTATANLLPPSTRSSQRRLQGHPDTDSPSARNRPRGALRPHRPRRVSRLAAHPRPPPPRTSAPQLRDALQPRAPPPRARAAHTRTSQHNPFTRREDRAPRPTRWTHPRVRHRRGSLTTGFLHPTRTLHYLSAGGT